MILSLLIITQKTAERENPVLLFMIKTYLFLARLIL